MIQNEYQRRRIAPSDIRDHLQRLHAEAATGDAVVIDLGVRTGNSTAAFLAAVEMFGGRVWSVDIVTPDLPWFGHEQWVFQEGDDLAIAGELPDQVDVVFIDTSHTFDQTAAELELYVPKVKPGGVVLLHDTELHTPEASPKTDPPFPVRAAVELYCADHQLVPEFIEGCYGLGVIRIPKGD